MNFRTISSKENNQLYLSDNYVSASKKQNFKACLLIEIWEEQFKKRNAYTAADERLGFHKTMLNDNKIHCENLNFCKAINQLRPKIEVKSH